MSKMKKEVNKEYLELVVYLISGAQIHKNYLFEDEEDKKNTLAQTDSLLYAINGDTRDEVVKIKELAVVVNEVSAFSAKVFKVSDVENGTIEKGMIIC